jgi:hypothetical protein
MLDLHPNANNYSMKERVINNFLFGSFLGSCTAIQPVILTGLMLIPTGLVGVASCMMLGRGIYENDLRWPKMAALIKINILSATALIQLVYSIQVTSLPLFAGCGVGALNLMLVEKRNNLKPLVSVIALFILGIGFKYHALKIEGVLLGAIGGGVGGIVGHELNQIIFP